MVKQLENRISSREVAEMMDVDHPNLLKKIGTINEDFRKVKIDFSKYWTESTYKVEGQTREYREFQITKMGCEFLAHKTTGTKGNLFTDRYMDRFEEMKEQLNNPVNTQLNAIDNVFKLLEGTKLMGAVVQAVVSVSMQTRYSTPLDTLHNETKRVIIDEIEDRNVTLSNEAARIYGELEANKAVIDMLNGTK